MNSIDTLLSRVHKLKKTGDCKWLACCPAYDDKSPSLAIKLADTQSPFFKFGTGRRASIRYDRHDLDAFLNRCREHGSGISTFDINEKRD